MDTRGSVWRPRTRRSGGPHRAHGVHDQPGPNTTYRYRIVATNANGTTTGTVHSFTTGPGT